MHTWNLEHFWTQGDGIIKGVALALLLMSILSWTISLYKAWSLLRLYRSRRQAARFWRQPDFAAAIDSLPDDGPLRQLADAAHQALAFHRQGVTQPPPRRQEQDARDLPTLSEWLGDALAHRQARIGASLHKGLAVLASVGATAPFIGLFGTVWGILQALLAIGVSGQASIDKVAGPIGEALVMTAFGLAVAIPAVLANNALARGNRAVLEELDDFGQRLHGSLVLGQWSHGDAAQTPPVTPIAAFVQRA
ncbi:MAG: MotA/TolQ/ExbB proton channel family protein [Candidatus Accumulibacter sp.]|jgi:biopolymer transport protein ExbB|nr:MotA/TolQ/ExbB proton channel family protein [Accumulibacter sp.]